MGKCCYRSIDKWLYSRPLGKSFDRVRVDGAILHLLRGIENNRIS